MWTWRNSATRWHIPAAPFQQSVELWRSLDLRSDGFEVEPETTAKLLRRGIRPYEVPISYAARSREEGKKLTAVDGLRVLRTLLRCRVD